MAARFIRKVRTASGAVAVQIITRQGRKVVDVDHVGSAHTDADLALLIQVARERLSPGQGILDLGPLEHVGTGISDIADWTGKTTNPTEESQRPGRRRVHGGDSKVVGTSSLVLWEALSSVYTNLGFDVLGDEAFKSLVLARIIEPTSKADTRRVLGEVGTTVPALSTIYLSLKRCQERDYRNQIAKKCLAYSARHGGRAAFLMYDVTSLHFENEKEDNLRKVGMSKEHRIDPQVQVGLLVDPSGFPLEVRLFEGNAAETTTLIPVLQDFQARHGVMDMIVVADAGMLSAGNLNALEDAGFAFIVGSRLTKAPYDLADHFEQHGDYFEDGQILESTRIMGQGRAARERRVVYQWSFKRHKRDNQTINHQITRAEKVAEGKTSLKTTRFLKVAGATKTLNQATIDRARQLAGLKGYVTNLPKTVMAGAGVIAAYHDLWKVEASFRMTKSDLKARPVFHHLRESIEAHLTIVFAALAITHVLTTVTGTSIKKIVQILRNIRSATIEVGGEHITLDPKITPEAQELLTAIKGH